jgi:hypothetical protein
MTQVVMDARCWRKAAGDTVVMERTRRIVRAAALDEPAMARPSGVRTRNLAIDTMARRRPLQLWNARKCASSSTLLHAARSQPRRRRQHLIARVRRTFVPFAFGVDLGLDCFLEPTHATSEGAWW